MSREHVARLIIPVLLANDGCFQNPATRQAGAVQHHNRCSRTYTQIDEDSDSYGSRNQYVFWLASNDTVSECLPGVSCGIPDFRSRDGLYSTLGGYYELDDPQQM